MRQSTSALGAIIILLSGCAGTPRLSALHDPLYRAETHTSTITARATETASGINQIRITATTGAITACGTSGAFLPSLIPCRTGGTTTSLTCAYANVKTEVTCALPLNLRPQRIVSYSVTTRAANNKSATVGPVTYAGGAPLTTATVRILGVNLTIPWETARPVIWRTDAPSSGTSRDDKIDLGFVPDADMPNYRAFTDDMQPMVRSLFYTDTNQFSNWTRVWKNLFNIWAGPNGADGEGCSRTFNSPASTVRGAFDGTAILHRNGFRDCASISLGGGSGTTQTNLGDASWVLLHEAGHFLFGLGDEYVGGGNASISTPQNVLGSQQACQNSSTGNSLPSAQCVQIGTSGTWRNDNGSATTMEDRVLNSDFQTLSGKAMSNLVAACVNGSCY